MTMMDSRVAERRRGVSEDRARRRLRRILSILLAVLVAVGGLWLVRSPLLSISTVEVTGHSMSDPAAVIRDLDMGVGRPTMDIDAGMLGRRIADDPWVADVAVSVIWPGTLVVDVTEHVPIAPVQAGDEWVSMAIDGSVLAPVVPPHAGDAAVAIDIGSVVPGDVASDRSVVGALEFIDATPADLRAGLRIRVDGESLVASVAGHEVELGRPVDMAMKAVVLEGLIAAGLDDGAAVNLVAPTRPAVSNPQLQPEIEGQVPREGRSER